MLRYNDGQMPKGEMLSEVEYEQLGKSKRGSMYEFVNEDEWESLRTRLIEKTMAANPLYSGKYRDWRRSYLELIV